MLLQYCPDQGTITTTTNKNMADSMTEKSVAKATTPLRRVAKKSRVNEYSRGYDKGYAAGYAAGQASGVIVAPEVSD